MSEHIKQCVKLCQRDSICTQQELMWTLVIQTLDRTLDEALDPNTSILEVSCECKKYTWI